MRYIIEFKVLNLAPKSASVLRAVKTIILHSCNVRNASEDTIVMATKEKGSISATYCAASNSDMTDCRNQTGMPGINMYYFSKDKILPQKWIRMSKFTGFPPVKKPALCCVHFDDTVVGVMGQLKNDLVFSFSGSVGRVQCL